MNICLYDIPLENISYLYGDFILFLVKDSKIYALFGAYGLWEGRYLYRPTPDVTRDHGFTISFERPHQLVNQFTTIMEYWGDPTASPTAILSDSLTGNKNMMCMRFVLSSLNFCEDTLETILYIYVK